MSNLGTEFKINIHIEPVDGFHMSEYDFECAFYVLANKKVVIPKSEMKIVDDDNYLAIIDVEKAIKIGKGDIMVEITAHIPDSDFDDGFRTEKTSTWTGVRVN